MFKHLLSGILFISLLFLLGCSDDGNSTSGGGGGGGLQDGATKTITAGGTSIEVAFVSAGTFTMGDREIANIWPNVNGWGEVERQVMLTQGFWISKYPITQAQYQAVIGTNPSFFSGNPNNPVESVNWFNAVAFAEAVGGRLPTEAEWEFAARGGNRSQGFIYSGSNNLSEVGWFWENIPTEGTQPVGLLKPNELGIYDMSGNVWEWTSDWWSNFGTASVVDPTGPITGSNRVLRGGSWFIFAELCRVASRYSYFPDYRWNYFGFRVVFPAI
ncbi:MAG: formylglycine-generating enzyme family protein [Chitinivibrionia bacterium]|nr:formylglycine-generating enzyme family protein [Chitinivibrionia bacterium]